LGENNKVNTSWKGKLTYYTAGNKWSETIIQLARNGNPIILKLPGISAHLKMSRL